MKLLIITGASGGLGMELTKLALAQGHTVIGVSRRSTLKHENFYSLKHDLSRPKGVEAKLERVMEKMNFRKIKSVHLINNAAGIEPVGPVGKLLHEGIEEHLTLNLTTPITLTNYLLKRFKAKFSVTNIVSGAALRPIAGWSLYCSTKSGLRMFTECLVEEGVKAISFSPGIMDTPMQATIRKQKVKDFGRVEEFKEYKNKNMLLPADEVAMRLMNLLDKPDCFNKTHYSVNELN